MVSKILKHAMCVLIVSTNLSEAFHILKKK